MTDRSAVRVRIRGRVQGVGFRYWTLEQARALGLDGWVRNRADGSVEAAFAGPPEAVAAMVEACRHGPPMAVVDALEERPELSPVGPGFSCRPTA